MKIWLPLLSAVQAPWDRLPSSGRLILRRFIAGSSPRNPASDLLKRCWYDQNFRPVATGKYENASFAGKGNFAKVAEVARSISLQIPAPFARLDFLISETDIVFGEITPAPGSHHAFNHEWDSKLGYLFAKAATRLASDVGYGKEFSAFRNMEKDESRLISEINAQG